ncbi:MAG: type IV secretory system conjugative DNA transfer family protein [Clostridiales bacterium]|nr:type IV secretory system conjugative DNA transfer family protein [Clostridiales bacterium]
MYAAKQGRNITVVLAKAIHTLNIGTTRSGKTTGFVDPVIQILCRTKTKPSMIITDPKGELFRKHAATLKAKGYNVLVLDIADPYRSARWNPFAAVIEKTRQIKQAEAAELSTVTVQKSGKYIDINGVVHDTFAQADTINKSLGKYVFGGKVFKKLAQAENARRVFIQELQDEIFVDLQDIIYTICPITSQQEPVWEQGARNFILALAIAMWEDLYAGECEEKRFNLHTLYKNVIDYGTEEKVPILSDFLSAGRDEFSKAAGLAGTVLSSQEKQLTSYLSTAQNYIVGFTDSGIRCLTSWNDIDIGKFDEQPTALFIKIPDEKENRHFLVTLLITQMYKILVEKARRNYRNKETKDEELKRNVYFIMDEFGNLPKFPNIRKIMAVGASRKIFMLPIIQSFAQLDVIYGKDEAAIIRDNSNIKIFIGSNDNTTIKEVSELCGKTKQRRISFGDGSDTAHFNVNTSAESVPLIYPSELEHLNSPPDRMGNAIVLMFGKKPINAKYEPVFKRKKIYKPIDDVPENDVEPQVFDERAHYYNFASRSVYIARSAEFAAQQHAEALRTVEELQDIPIEPPAFDPMAGADERLMPLMLSIKSKVPQKLGIDIESAFFDHNTDGIIDACIAAMGYARLTNKRWLCAECAKLKNIIQQLAAKSPLDIQEQGDYEDDDND